MVLSGGVLSISIKARRVKHFLDPDTHLDYTLNIFLCLHLEIRISSFLLICIGTSVPDTSLAENFLDNQVRIEFYF